MLSSITPVMLSHLPSYDFDLIPISFYLSLLAKPFLVGLQCFVPDQGIFDTIGLGSTWVVLRHAA